MTIPPEHLNPKLVDASKRFDDLGEIRLSDLRPLQPDDYALLGNIIQVSNETELHLRECLQSLGRAGLLTEQNKRNYHLLRPSRLVPALKAALIELGSPKDTEDLLDEVHLRRAERNLFAHWTARRCLPPDEDCLIFFTRDGYDAQQVFKTKDPTEQLVYCMMNVSDIRGLAVLLKQTERRMALLAGQLFDRFPRKRSDVGL